jgi:putative ATP-dependent endonuclease of the OLD family
MNMTTGSPSATAPSISSVLAVPTIYRIDIQRFRGIQTLSWCPGRRVNVILGGGDVGKTTILDAVALLLSPANVGSLADADYYDRKISDGFVIEAIVSLPPQSGINHQFKPSWPWEWNGTDAVVPSTDPEAGPTGEPVYRLRVRGTEDLDLIYEIVQPDDTTDSLSVALRRSIGLVRLGGDDRNDRDLRLVQGSALDRLLSDKSLRSRMAASLATSDVKSQLAPEKKAALTSFDESFVKEKLPHGLDLSIVGGQGASIASMVALPRPMTAYNYQSPTGGRHAPSLGPGDCRTSSRRGADHGRR